ncbi:MAG: phosphoribosylglycinamide formyltransferase [Cytophagales bacterium]
MSKKIKVAIFASGSGSNAENICQYFRNSHQIEIVSIFCNNADAYVIERATKLNLPIHIFTKEDFVENGIVMRLLDSEGIDFVVLAGFLWLIPKFLVAKYPKRIINIHPALLPNFGGKGMYGRKVHEAVKQANHSETGITIHFVNENYDEGDVIFQARTDVYLLDDADSIAQKVHELEYLYYPKIVEETILKIF